MSEVVSFILTFAIVTTMIGILYTGGTVSIEQLQTGNQIQNAEGVFLVVADSFEELQEGQAPKRAGSLDLDVGASAAVVNQSTINVTVNGPDFNRTLVTRSLEYRLDKRSVVYETGALFRMNRGDSALINEPGGIHCSPSTGASVVSIVTLVQGDGGNVASDTVTITGVHQSTELLFPTSKRSATPVENVTIDVTSPREAAWERYLEESSGWEDADGDGRFACENVEQVFVRHTVVEVEFTV